MLILLGLPRSLVSMLGAMLGRHPAMYDVPETHLLGCETVAEWWARCDREIFAMSHGLLRAVAEVYFGSQTELTITQAQGWIRRRLHCTTGYVLEEIAERVRPLLLIEKSASLAFSTEGLGRALEMFPDSKFLHVVQHPRTYCQAVMDSIREGVAAGSVPLWLRNLAAYPERCEADGYAARRVEDSDPQRAWFALHRTVCEFLAGVSQPQKLRIRSEDLLDNTELTLRGICGWVGLTSSPEDIEAMTHPEGSPYACWGPPNARYGDDDLFLQSPGWQPRHAQPYDLEAPLGWRPEREHFLPEVTQLAKEFQYK